MWWSFCLWQKMTTMKMTMFMVYDEHEAMRKYSVIRMAKAQ